MCLGIPGKIIEIYEEGLPIAKVDVGGIRRNISIDLVHHPEDPLKPGDWVLVHVGFAMSKVNEEEAIQTLDLLREMNEEFEKELEELRNSRIE